MIPEWLLGILIGGVIVGLAGAIWRAHEKRDQERFDAIWDQIGRSSEEGMRKSVHDWNSRVSMIALLEKTMERIEDKLERRDER